MTDQNHDIILRDLGDEYQRMDSVRDATAMIQQNTGENGYARRTAQPSRKRHGRNTFHKRNSAPRGELHYCTLRVTS
ncbi:unnamed protein product [Hymenolepis diminuta]|uniref:Uncharacterized protein n=1 Tax=Hymenolepis diminuta TaxID=6216 RepID=A0A564YYK8_HYMDI|nr:unnamed protein product [Hymenolepis diminuta]